MKKKHVWTVVTLLVCLLMITGSTIFATSIVRSSKEEKEEPISYDTFSAWTDIEEFQTIPVMDGDNAKIGEAANYGGSNQMVQVNDTTVEEYKEYLATLEKNGFKKHSDNGEDGMEGNAYTAAYTKGDLSVVVTQLIKGHKTYISAMKDVELSDRMIYKDEYVEGVPADAKTKIHLLELNNNGACLIIQLKNGHFVVHDGGNGYDAIYLLEFLESLTPGDEIPVVEGWFISHPHGDHFGALQEIANKTSYVKRLYVNEVFFHVPPTEMLTAEDPLTSNLLSKIHRMFTAENGEPAKGHNPQYGQRFYFCDVMIDTCMTTDQMDPESYYSTDVNDTSSWFMNHIEGQRVLFAGDASHGGQRSVMNLYDKEYFELDVFVVLHHGMNVYQYFNEYIKAKTILYPSFNLGSIYTNKYPHFARLEENAQLRESAEEAYTCGGGTMTLTFPYKVGEAKKAAPCEWKYNGGVPKERYTTNWGWDYVEK